MRPGWGKVLSSYTNLSHDSCQGNDAKSTRKHEKVHTQSELSKVSSERPPRVLLITVMALDHMLVLQSHAPVFHMFPNPVSFKCSQICYIVPATHVGDGTSHLQGKSGSERS